MQINPPQHLTNLDAEHGALGYLLLNPTRHDLFEKLNINYFTDSEVVEDFKLFASAYNNGLNLDFLSTGVQRARGLQYLSSTSLSASFESNFIILLQTYMAREAYRLGIQITEYAKSQQEGQILVELIQQTLDEYNQAADQKQNIFCVKDILSNWLEEKVKNLDPLQSKSYFLPFQNKLTDEHLKDYFVNPGHLCSVVARTKSGKTTFLGQIAVDALKRERAVLFVTLEISANEMTDKLLAFKADAVSYTHLTLPTNREV